MTHMVNFMILLNIFLIFILYMCWAYYFKYAKIDIKNKKLFCMLIHLLSFVLGLIFISKLLINTKIEYYELRWLTLLVVFITYNSIGGIIVNLSENNIKRGR